MCMGSRETEEGGVCFVCGCRLAQDDWAMPNLCIAHMECSWARYHWSGVPFPDTPSTVLLVHRSSLCGCHHCRTCKLNVRGLWGSSKKTEEGDE